MQLNKSLELLQNYIENDNYSGFDPYDGLKSPFFNLPFLRKSKKIRFLFQQFIKRLPINLRFLFEIKKGKNPVTLGLSIQSYAYLIEIYPNRKEEFLLKIELLLNDLELLKSIGFEGTSWGYDFDWEARYATINAYQPTVVATGIISNALFECWRITGNKKCADFVINSSIFVQKVLNRTYFDENGKVQAEINAKYFNNEKEIEFQNNLFCFSYSTHDQQIVLNASMKGVRVLAQTFLITNDELLIKIARNAVLFVLKQQQENGSFMYSNKREKIDNYHTGYVLDCLDEYQKCFETNEFDEQLKKGFEFYKNSFFTDEGIPKFYNDEIFPIDCTAAGQSLLTLTRFSEFELANKVSKYMTENMQDKRGFFYFRKYKNGINKTPFMRWSNAWMFVGMCYFLKNENSKK